MVSKAATIGLLAFLVVALIGGSAYILLRPNDPEAARNSLGQNGTAGQNRNEAAIERQGQGLQGGEREQGQALGRQGGNGPGAGVGGGTGQGRQGASGVLGEGAADHPVGTWATVSGRVAAFTGDELTVQTDEGPVTVHLGPEWYWDDEGITLQDGDEVEVSGFYEGDAFEVAEIKNHATQETVTLRDATGRPLWAGRGRGSADGS